MFILKVTYLTLILLCNVFTPFKSNIGKSLEDRNELELFTVQLLDLKLV